MLRLLTFCTLLLIPGRVWAQYYGLCDTIFRSGSHGCNNLAASNTMGGSYPMLFDAINVNPASVPIYRTPLGVEYSHTDGKNNFALIKGLENFGGGISAKNSSATFFGPYENYKVAIKQKYGDEAYQPRGLDPNLNFSTALNLLPLKEISLPLGLGYKFNNDKKIWSPTLGFGFKTRFLNVGASAYQEKPKASEDEYYRTKETNDVITANVGLKAGNLVVDYTVFNQQTKTVYELIDTSLGDPDTFTSRYRITTQILSANFFWEGLSLCYGLRTQDDSRAKDSGEQNVIDSLGASYKKRHQLFGASYKFRELFSVGYFHNYELDAGTSIIAQLFIPLGRI